ncbi:MAG TPA: hypothetical protein VJ731_01685 [Terriglobales bacterium]|jgi:hypothetical protein|nr:hypothetical protein [Terriglobales bacterium]
MNRFVVFWDSENDPELVARHYAIEAETHAVAIKKQISTKLVDINSSDPDKHFWDPPNTIECVTVNEITKKDTSLNPEDSRIDEMVDNL